MLNQLHSSSWSEEVDVRSIQIPRYIKFITLRHQGNSRSMRWITIKVTVEVEHMPLIIEENLKNHSSHFLPRNLPATTLKLSKTIWWIIDEDDRPAGLLIIHHMEHPDSNKAETNRMELSILLQNVPGLTWLQNVIPPPPTQHRYFSSLFLFSEQNSLVSYNQR